MIAQPIPTPTMFVLDTDAGAYTIYWTPTTDSSVTDCEWPTITFPIGCECVSYGLPAETIQQASKELAKAAKLHKQEAAKAREELQAELAKMPPPFRPPEVRRSHKPPKMSTAFATRKMCRHPSKRRAFRTKG